MSAIGLWILATMAASSLSAAADLRLVAASQKRDWSVVRALVAQKIDVNARDGDSATALHWAARWDNVEIAELLMRSGARAGAANDYGVTPLLLACTNGSAVMVERLLVAGASAGASSLAGVTALMECARTGSADGVRALFRHGAHMVNATEPHRGQTALMWAIANGHADVARVLIAEGADVNARTKVRPLFVAFGDGREGPFADTALGGFTPILFAARQGSVEGARVLLAAGANVNDRAPDGNSVLVVASFSGHGMLAAFLLDHGADPTAAGAGYTALHAAVLKGDVELVRALLAHGADPNARMTRGTPVLRNYHYYALDEYLKGASPFLLAAKFGEIEIMRALASRGADSSLPLEDGTTPLMVASGMTWRTEGNSGDRRDRTVPVEITNALVANQAVILEGVKLVVELGVDVNAANSEGETALHAATQKKFGSVVDFLVSRGGNMDAKDKRGRTPRTSRASKTER